MMKIVPLLFLPLVVADARPAAVRVQVETSAGNFVIEVHRDWAPLGSARFEELVRKKYFDDSRFFRVVEGRWAQFGIAGNPEVAQKWNLYTTEFYLFAEMSTSASLLFSSNFFGEDRSNTIGELLDMSPNGKSLSGVSALS